MSPDLAMPDWAATYGVRGDLDHARVSASALGVSPEWSCSEQLAFSARPAAFLDVPFRDAPRPEFETFALGLVRDVMLRSLGAVDADGPIVAPATALVELTRDRDWDPASLTVAKAAINGYFEVFKRLRAEPAWDDAKFASSIVAADVGDDRVIEWFAWGVHVVRAGQRIRETHLLRWRGGGRAVDSARIAAAARNLADGFVPKPARWSTQYGPMPSQPAAPERVIVRELGLLDASDVVLFDGTPAEARADFDASVPQRLAIFTGGIGNPGSRCAGCKVLELCPHPVREPGILGVAGRAQVIKALTPGDLSMHRTCPAQYHLKRELGLPTAPVDSGAAAHRGTLVHEWLAAAHDRLIACRATDPPGDGLGDIATDLGWTSTDYELAQPLLGQHIDTCPFVGGDVEAVTSERPLTVVDTDVNVVFSTRFDSVASLRDGSRVVRETKTINPRSLPDDEGELIELFPQIAFPIVALAAGLDPLTGRITGAPLAGRVELELLNDGYATVVSFDTADSDVVLAARVALAQQVDVLIHDREHPAYPGIQCRWCSVRDWCPAKSEVEIKLSETLESEPQSQEPVLDTLALIARVVAGTDHGDEDVPF